MQHRMGQLIELTRVPYNGEMEYDTLTGKELTENIGKVHCLMEE